MHITALLRDLKPGVKIQVEAGRLLAFDGNMSNVISRVKA
jgi:hypothetical protein